MNVLVNTAVHMDATTLMVALSATAKLGLNLTALDTHAKVRMNRVAILIPIPYHSKNKTKA